MNNAIRCHQNRGVPDAAVAKLLAVVSAWWCLADHARKRGLCLIVRERHTDEQTAELLPTLLDPFLDRQLRRSGNRKAMPRQLPQQRQLALDNANRPLSHVG